MIKELLQNKTYIQSIKDDPKDRLEIEVGDIKQPDFYPQVKLKRWDNEVNFSARLLHNEADPKVQHSGNKIDFLGDKIEAHFYDLPADDKLIEGGYEFEVILKEKPPTNVIEMSLETKGLEFDYQPALNEELKIGDEFGRIVRLTETDAYDKDNKSINHRPENVVGSYAVYYKDCPPNFVDGKLYHTGKAFHIFRPQIVDANGHKVWGELNIDIKAKKLTVTIPQEFLDNAVYPIRHAAGLTFGYSGTPGSTQGWSTGTIKACGDGYTGAVGTATSISVYARDNDSGDTGGAAIYNNTTLVASTTSINISGAINWKTANLANEVLSAINYYLALQVSAGNSTLGYDSTGATNGYIYEVVNWAAFPNPIAWHNPTAQLYKFGVYVTYNLIVSAALTGTVTTATEADIRAGGKTIILTLTNDTWVVAAGGLFDAQRQNIIDGLDSAQAEATGWDAEVKAKIPVTDVVRTSNTVVTITLSAEAGYNITANETITVTVPSTAMLLNAGAVVASPTFTITPVATTYAKTIQAKGRVKQVGLVKTAQTKARVKQTGVIKTITAKARTKQPGVVKTEQTKARVRQVGLVKTTQVKGRIKKIDLAKTTTAKGRIKRVGLATTAQARARIHAQWKGFVNMKSKQQAYPIPMNSRQQSYPKPMNDGRIIL